MIFENILKNFGELYKPNLFNISVEIDYSYLEDLYKNDIENVVVKIVYDDFLSIIGYELMKKSVIFNLDEKNTNTLFILSYDSENHPEIVVLDKKSVIYLDVKKCLRILKIKKMLDYGK